MKTAVEQIYYLEKMRFWGGSRITAFNQYCYRVHPLLDDLLAQYSFGFTLDEKRDAAVQRRIITASSPIMARVRSSYYDRPMTWSSQPERQGLVSGVKKLRYIISGWLVSAKNASFLSPGKTTQYTTAFKPEGLLQAVTGISFAKIFNRKIQGLYLTLEKSLHLFREKLTPSSHR